MVRIVRGRKPRRTRRGTAMIFAVGMMFTLFSFLALTVDTGYLAGARAEMRRTADAAALAGGWEVFEGLEAGDAFDPDSRAVREAAAAIAAMNPVLDDSPLVDTSAQSSEVVVGYLDAGPDSQINRDATRPYYAVQVLLRRTSDRNGEVPFFFGRIFGEMGRPMTARATAVMAREVSGFRTPAPGETLDILPFALDKTTWDSLMAATAGGSGGSDAFSYDPDTGRVGGGKDGVFEVNLYPQGTGSPGNRGTVDIGGSNNSTSDISRQIVHGISPGDLQKLGKPLSLSGGSMTLEGDTGISAGVKDDLASIIGQKRVIPIFSSVKGNGNNAVYTIVRWAGVRVIDVRLTGKMSEKRLIVQPAAVLSPHAIPAPEGGASDFILTPVHLAR